MVQFLAPVVNSFLDSYPDVKVDLTIGERDIDMIDEGYDIAVRMVPPPDSSLIARSLATWRHVLCCSHGYIAKHGRPEQLAELAERNCIRHVNYPYGDEWRFVDRKGTPASVRVSGNLITNSAETLHRAALHGVGVCVAPGFMMHDDLETGRLVRLLPEYRPVEFAMNAIYLHRHHLSAKVRVFIDLLVRHSAEQQKLINPYS
jgi:DNA-binding transcriptional LysR family regulator